MNTQSLGYRSDIDGLRAIAVLGVVLFHAGVPGFRGGYTGVDVFFVISGFLITALLQNELSSKGCINFTHFFARRIRRLMPTFVLVSVVTLGAGAMILSPALGELQGLTKSVIAAATVAANFHFLSVLESYFAGPAELEPMLHTWSLAVEEQYYLVWPAVLSALWLVIARSRHRLLVMKAVFALALAGSVFISLRWSGEQATWAFYLLPSRAWELLAGGLLALLISDGLRPRPELGQAVAAGGFALVAIAFCTSAPAGLFPMPFALLPVIGAIGIIVGNAWNSRSLVAQVLSWRPIVAIGVASYAWYLWHWPMLSLMHIHQGGEVNLVRNIAVVALSLALAFATVRFYENPLRQSRVLVDRHVIVVGIAALFAVGGGASLLGSWAGQAQPTAAEAAVRFAQVDKYADTEKCHRGMAGAGADKLSPCLASGSGSRILLWGDSYANHWTPALDEWARHRGEQAAIEHLTKDACPPLIGALPTRVRIGARQPFATCKTFNDLAAARLGLASAAGPSGVVLSAAWWFRATDYDLSQHGWFLEREHSFDVSVRGANASLAVLEDRLRRTLRLITDHGLRVLVVMQSPQLVTAEGQPLRVPECLFRRSATFCSMPTALHYERVRVVNAVLAKVAAEFAAARVFDPATLLCDAATCHGNPGATAAYTDEGHISASMARAIAPRLGPQFDWLTSADRAELAISSQ